eukprot:m.276707 g.276707  ORF g.276707 m.276707 type:complete len:1088 (+) comp17700_c0_seq4:178-3441(+)
MAEDDKDAPEEFLTRGAIEMALNEGPSETQSQLEGFFTSLLQPLITPSNSSQRQRAKALLQHELKSRNSLFSDQQRSAITVAFERLISNWDIYKRRDSRLLEDLMDAAGDAKEELIQTIEVVGEEVIETIAQPVLDPLINEQREQSRAQSLDGLTDFPTPSVQCDLKGLGVGSQGYDLTNRFIRSLEVPLRRIAQLARPEFHSLVSLGFHCPRSLEKEREFAESVHLTQCEATGWIIARAVRAMWAGERDVHVLTPMVDDRRSLIVVKAILSLIKIMDRRLLLREIPELEVLVNALLDLKQQSGARFNEAADLLATMIATAQRGGGTELRRSPDTTDKLLKYPAGGACLRALGFEAGSNRTWSLSRAPAHVQQTLEILHDIKREPESPLEWVPLSRNVAWSSPGHDCSFNVVQPGRHDTVYMGTQCTVTWLKNPESQVELVDLDLVRGDFTDVEVHNGIPVPKTLKSVRMLALGAPNTGQYVFKMPDDFQEGEYFKITVSATLNRSDRDRSLPFDIRRSAPATTSSPDSEIEMKAPEAYSSMDEYSKALEAYLIQKGPGAALVLRNSVGSLAKGASAIFVHLHDDKRVLINASETEVTVSLEDLQLPPEEEPTTAAPQPPVVEESAAVKVEESRRSKEHAEAPKVGQVWPRAQIKATGCHRHPQGHHIFVSYRRADGEQYAGRIAFYLATLGYDVFFDRECLGPFRRFDESLLRNIYNAGAFIMVMTPEYLNIDRLNNPNDWCRKELEAAVESDRVIVPLKCGAEPFGVYQALNSERIRLRLTTLNVVNLPGEFFREVMTSIHIELQKTPMKTAFMPPSLPDTDRQLDIELECTEQDTLASGSPVKIKFKVEGKVERVRLDLVSVDEEALVATLELAYLCKHGLNVYEWRITSRTAAGRYAIHLSAHDEPALCNRSSCFVVSTDRPGSPTKVARDAKKKPPPPKPAPKPQMQPPRVVSTSASFHGTAKAHRASSQVQPAAPHPLHSPDAPSTEATLDVDVSTATSLDAYEDSDVLANFVVPATASLANLRVLFQEEEPDLKFVFRKARAVGSKTVFAKVAQSSEGRQLVKSFGLGDDGPVFVSILLK